MAGRQGQTCKPAGTTLRQTGRITNKPTASLKRISEITKNEKISGREATEIVLPKTYLTSSYSKPRFNSLRQVLVCVKSELAQDRGVLCYGWCEQNASN